MWSLISGNSAAVFFYIFFLKILPLFVVVNARKMDGIFEESEVLSSLEQWAKDAEMLVDAESVKLYHSKIKHLLIGNFIN